MGRKLTLLLLLTPGIAFGKKIDPNDFNLSATVIAVSSHDDQVSSRTTRVDPCAGMSANDPRRARVNCEPTQSHTTVQTVTTFVLSVSIGDKVYDLEGRRLELGSYRARFTGAGGRERIEILVAGEKGKWTKFVYRIVGEHQAPTQ